MLQIQDIVCTLKNREKILERAIAIAHKSEKSLPSGRLRINHNRGVVEYYRITDKNDTRGKYLKKNDIEFIKKLAQKDYFDKQIKCAKKELEEIRKIQKILQGIIEKESSGSDILYKSDCVYSMMREERKKLIEPILLSNHEYADRWKKEEYKKNEYRNEEKIYPTKQGDMVRSKSEAMLADMYYDVGIPYRYEAELRLNSGKKIYPDFTIFDVTRLREIYHEHMGLLDDEEYRLHNLRKIEEYRKNGIFAGKNLFITHESSGCPLNIREIEKCVRWLLDM